MEVEKVTSQGILKSKKLFICTSHPEKSFLLDLSSYNIEKITIEELIQFSNTIFKSSNRLLEMSEVHNKMTNWHTVKKNHFLKHSHMDFLPFYFSAKQTSFEIDVLFNKEIHTFEIPIYTTQTELLLKISEKINIPQNQLYLLHQQNVINSPLQYYKQVNVYIASNIIFYDNKEYIVDFNLSIQKNSSLFKFAFCQSIYKDNLAINKEDTFVNAGIRNEDKLYSFFMMDAQIKDIKAQIKSNYTNEEAKDLYLKYFPDEDGELLIKKVDSILFLSLEENKTLKISVQKLNEKIINLTCKSHDPIEFLKQQLSELENIPIDQQILILAGKKLEDGKKINEYNIQEDSTIYLTHHQRGFRGGRSKEESKLFVDLENENSKKLVNFSRKAPKYRTAIDGLNIEGKCINRECRYYHKKVICKIGYDAIEIIKDEYNQIVCPRCLQRIELITCGFVNCQYSWCGIKVEDGRERLIQSKIIQTDTLNYTTYNPIKDDGSSNMVSWKQLFLYAKFKESSHYPECSICLKCIKNSDQITTAETCYDKESHKCHIQCLEKMVFIEKRCVLCLHNF